MFQTVKFKTISKWSVLLSFGLLASCQFNSSYTNHESDKKDAEVVTDKFYQLVTEEKYNEVFRLFSKDFFATSDSTKLKNILLTTREKLGPAITMTLENWQTEVVKGTNAGSHYALQYQVKHERYEAQETFRLAKEGNEIKIVSYTINSDGFFVPEQK